MKTFVKSFGMKFKYGTRPDAKPSKNLVKDNILNRLVKEFRPLTAGTKPFKNNNRIVVIQQMLVDTNNKSLFLSLDYTKILNSQILLHFIKNQNDGLVEDEGFEEDMLENEDNTDSKIFTGSKDYCILFMVEDVNFYDNDDTCEVKLKTFVTVKGNNNPLLILLSKLEASLKAMEISNVDVYPVVKDYVALTNEITQMKIKTIWKSNDAKRPNENFETITTIKAINGNNIMLSKVKEMYQGLLGRQKSELALGEEELVYIKGLDKQRQNLQFEFESGDDDYGTNEDGQLKTAIIYKKQLPDIEGNIFDIFISFLQGETSKIFTFSIPPLNNESTQRP